MKKITLLLFSLITITFYGQSYTVTSFNNTYTYLVSPQLLTTTVWDDPDFVIAPDFPVIINGNAYDTLLLNDLGCTIYGIKNGTMYDIVNPSLIDVIDRGYDAEVSQSNISMKTDGFIGNRILKIQWQNVGSYGEYDMGGNSMSINFQLWFYEQGSYIEVRYGNSNVTDVSMFYEDETGVGVAILEDNYSSGDNNVYLTGSTGFPSVTVQGSYLTGTPQAGQVYRFTPSMSIGVNENSVKNLVVYPNPCRESLHVNGVLEKYEIYDAQGRLVKIDVVNAQKIINVADLKKGVYIMIGINSDGENTRISFVKE